MNFGFHYQKDYWKSIFPKRRRLEFNHNDLKSLTLRDTDNGNRLTIDKGHERLELAVGASEVEREWIYNYLMNSYL